MQAPAPWAARLLRNPALMLLMCRRRKRLGSWNFDPNRWLVKSRSKAEKLEAWFILIRKNKNEKSRLERLFWQAMPSRPQDYFSSVHRPLFRTAWQILAG